MDNNTVITLENVRLIFRNFSGNADKFNAQGDRNFCIDLIDIPDVAKQLADDGFNVKFKPAQDEDGVDRCYLKVNIKFGSRPPRINLITSTSRTLLSPETVGILDSAEDATVDITIVPYHWELPNGSTGITAYLRSMFFTLQEDDLDRKYASVGIEQG